MKWGFAKKSLPVLLLILLCVQDAAYAMPGERQIVSEEESIPEEAADAEDTEDEGEAADVGISLSAPSAILMEASTGQVICEKDADTKRAPASVTKIMTMLLIFDALESGKITLEDEVTTSEYAASMGGSQVFLEPGEIQTAETLLKCIAVASANDACVAMAEHISGSEEQFVAQMNERAEGLGMEQTHFVNCNGLDASGHLTTARDIALMSRELIIRYPQYQDYSMIWMEDITHETKKGTSKFGLTNTNKLVRQYEYATGLKTGSTGEAKFCVSATAEKNGVSLIAVVMAAENSKERFQDAAALLDYGFGKCQIYRDEDPPALSPVKIRGGVKEEAGVGYETSFSYLDLSGNALAGVTCELRMEKELRAPVEKGDAAGELVYFLDGKEIGSVRVLVRENVKEAGFSDYLKKAACRFVLFHVK